MVLWILHIVKLLEEQGKDIHIRLVFLMAETVHDNKLT